MLDVIWYTRRTRNSNKKSGDTQGADNLHKGHCEEEHTGIYCTYYEHHVHICNFSIKQ